MLSPNAISATGHVRVKDTLQIRDDEISNVYACGDVAESGAPNPNARVAMRQAMIVAQNILQVVRGEGPTHTYETSWADGVIKLTLGLVCPFPFFAKCDRVELTKAAGSIGCLYG